MEISKENQPVVVISSKATKSEIFIAGELIKYIKKIVKKRVCFVYQSQYFEVDLFEFSNDKAILEIELTNENSKINLPPFISFIKEVTEDFNYTNYNLAKTQTLDY